MLAHEKDYSGFLLAGAITWVFLVPITFVGMIGSYALYPWLLLVPLFGLAAWTLLMGFLLFVRPRKVQRLTPRLSTFSSQISSKEAGVRCFWLSTICWYAGILWIAEIIHHAPSGLAGYVFGLSIFGGFWLGRWWAWRHVRRP